MYITVSDIQKKFTPASIATARSGVYGLLARIFRDEPDAILIKILRQPVFANALESVGISPQTILLYAPTNKLVETLSLEYTRLFIGPGHHLSPHESVYRKDGNGRLWGESTAAVKIFIEYCGFKGINDTKFIPDHISIELEFMQVITAIEARALQKNNMETVARCKQIESHFIFEHLCNWITLFCDEVITLANHPFYREMASLTQDFIEKEKLDNKMVQAAIALH